MYNNDMNNSSPRTLKFIKSFLVVWNIFIALYLIASLAGPGDVNTDLLIGLFIFLALYWAVSIILLIKINKVLKDTSGNIVSKSYMVWMLLFFLIPTMLIFFRMFAPVVVSVGKESARNEWEKSHCTAEIDAFSDSTKCYTCDDGSSYCKIDSK